MESHVPRHRCRSGNLAVVQALFPARQDFEIVDENLRTAMRFFGHATGSGETVPLPGVDIIYSGLDYGVFNIAMISSPLMRGELESRVNEAAQYYAPRSSHWSFWLCEGWIEPSQRGRAVHLFLNRGMRTISQPPGMLSHGLRRTDWPVPEFECRPVIDGPSRTAFAAITGACFDIPAAIASSVYEPEQAWQGAYRGYIAVVRGIPVATVAIVAAGGALGIYSLGTLPLYRRRGYGEALMRAAIERERERTGIEKLVLQSTNAGYRLYRRLGFRDVTRYSVYLTR